MNAGGVGKLTLSEWRHVRQTAALLRPHKRAAIEALATGAADPDPAVSLPCLRMLTDLLARYELAEAAAGPDAIDATGEDAQVTSAEVVTELRKRLRIVDEPRANGHGSNGHNGKGGNGHG